MFFENEPATLDPAIIFGFNRSGGEDIDPGFNRRQPPFLPWSGTPDGEFEIQPARGGVRGGRPDGAIDITSIIEGSGAYGRTPLTPEQTRSGYAKMFGVNESEVGPDMRLQLLSAQPDQDGQDGREDSPYRGYGAPDDLPPPPEEPRRGAVAPGMGVTESEQGPMNEPYDPESPAVRGRDGVPLPYDLQREMDGYLPKGSAGGPPWVEDGSQRTDFTGMDLSKLQIHTEQRPWYMPKWADGMALENHIYINPERLGGGVFDPERPYDKRLLLEEVAHAGQYQRGGMTRAGYLWESLWNGYGQNKYETEAQGIAKQIGQGQSHQPVQSRTLTE